MVDTAYSGSLLGEYIRSSITSGLSLDEDERKVKEDEGG